MISLDELSHLTSLLYELGYDDVAWSESLSLPTNEDEFALECIFVIVNSGMRFTTARGIFERIKAALLRGASATTVFGHLEKAAAIDRLWRDRATFFRLFLIATDKIQFLGNLPWIGPITKHHAARNLGVNTIKPDVHLQRLSAAYPTSPMALCSSLASRAGLRIGTIDVILWRGCALGLIDSRSGELRFDNVDSARKVRSQEHEAVVATHSAPARKARAARRDRI